MGVHLPSLARLREKGILKIAGVCDTNQNNAKLAAEKFEVPAFGEDWQKLVEETKSEAVAVCLPPGPNAEVSIQAVEMGLHVICEKPPGRNASQAKRMAAAALAHPDLVTMIAFNRRFAPLYTKTMKYSRQLSLPHTFYGRFTRPGLGDRPSDTMEDWITSDGSHALDLSVATMGYPRRLAVGRLTAGLGPDNVWTVQLFSDQGSSMLLFDFTAGRRVERFEWSGPGFDVLLELPERGQWSQRGEAMQEWPASELTGSSDFFVNYGFLDEYLAFAQAINGQGPRPQADFPYALDFMTLVKSILDCPSGEMREVLPAVVREEDASQEIAERPMVLPGSPPQRPVVYIMQGAPAQTKYFSMEKLSSLAEVCDLRLRKGDEWRSGLQGAHALVTGWGGMPLAPEDLSLADDLKLVVVVGSSVRPFSPDYLVSRNVALCNTADAIAQSVAEHCLLLTLAGLRRLTEVDHQMRQGNWPPTLSGGFSLASLVLWAKHNPIIRIFKSVLKPLKGPLESRISKKSGEGNWSDLQGHLVGLVGWGHIARNFCKLLQPFNCQILINSDHISEEELSTFKLHRASLGEIFGASKVISLHKGATEHTRGLIGAQELALLKPGTVLINTARAGLIDEQALITSLRKGQIVVGLDVFNREPLAKNHPLRKLDNAILTPHNSSSTNECYRRVGDQALDTVLKWLENKPLDALEFSRLANMT